MEPLGAPRRHHQARPPAPVQLADVTDSADELPLAGGRAESAKAEAPEVARLLDLAEDGFDDGLAAGVVGVAVVGG